jgi:hypothetical protein
MVSADWTAAAKDCNSDPPEKAQAEVNRGDALIHSFWYAEAEKAFRGAAEADAECGMAWWGVAMANLHPIWAPPTPDELKTGREAAEKATEGRAEAEECRGAPGEGEGAVAADGRKSPLPARRGKRGKAPRILTLSSRRRWRQRPAGDGSTASV